MARLRGFRLRDVYLHPDTFIMVIAYLVIGITLILQPRRYDSTPAYGLLLDIFPQAVWGGIYLAAAAGLAVALIRPNIRALLVIVHTIAIALTASWLGAFVIRYISDNGTTAVNCVSWSVFLTLLIRSALLLDESATAHKLARELARELLL